MAKPKKIYRGGRKYKKAVKSKKTNGYRISFAITTNGKTISSARHFDKRSEMRKFLKALKSGKRISQKDKTLKIT